MMGNTHVATGIATATLIVQPHDVPTLCATIIGGAVGGIICDIEVRSSPECRDALYARLITGAIVIVCLIVDWLNGSVLIHSILNITNLDLIIGLGFILFSMIKGRFSQHRTFTHSITFLLLMSIGITTISIEIAVPFIIGFVSHILLDLMNKMPVKIFYPFSKKGYCLYWCYASKTANKVILYISTFACVAEIAYFGWKIIAG